MNRREQRRLDPLTRLVARLKSITEGFDDVIGRHAEMRRPLLDHLQHGMQHAVYGAEGSIVAFVEAAQTIEVAEQFVRPVDRKSTRLNSSHGYISYAVFCLKKKKIKTQLSLIESRCICFILPQLQVEFLTS